MPKTRKLQLSFASGEIDTQMYGRIDAQQYQSGLATCKNWLINPRGGLHRRPGFQRVSSSLDSVKKSRLIPFTFSVDQQLAIELTDQKIRFHVDGETIVWANFKQFRFQVSDNTITFNEPHGFTQGERIVFYAEDDDDPSTLADAFGSLPTPFNLYPGSFGSTEHYVDIVDTKRIKVLDAPTGSVRTLGNGSAGFNLYAFKHGGVAGKFGPAQEYRRFVHDVSLPTTLWQPKDVSSFCLSFGTHAATSQHNDWQQGERVELVYQITNPPQGQSSFVRLPGIPQPLYVDYTAGGTANCPGLEFGLRTAKEFVGTAKGDNPDTWVDDLQIDAARSSAPNANNNGNGRMVWIRQFHEAGDYIYLDYPRTGTATWLNIEYASRVLRVTSDFGSTPGYGVTPVGVFNEIFANHLEFADDQGALVLASPFVEDELFDIEYDQSGDVVTFTHPNHPPQDLKRFGVVNWTLGPITFGTDISPPSNINGSASRGQAYSCVIGRSGTADDDYTRIGTADADLLSVPFAIGDQIYIENVDYTASDLATFGITDTSYYTIAAVAVVGPGSGSGFSQQQVNQFRILNLDGTAVEHTDGTSGGAKHNAGNPDTKRLNVYYSVASADRQNKYRVTAVDARGQESLSSDEITLDNILTVAGAKNTITFDASFNARSYNVYKEINGTFGFIGQVDHQSGVTSYSFEDDNIGPDVSQTLLIPDADVQASFQPRAAARFEQRRCFGGSDALPRTLFMSRSGTESSFSYRFPVQSDDRISVDLASREAHVIRHIVPVQDLLLMTQQGEFRVTAINSDAITPSTIAIRQQSYVGSNTVHPQVVNNSVVFCAARGGHARQVSFSAEMQGYLTGDLSLRASHLFDGFTLDDLAYSKAPVPVLWFVSSTGKLLCLTYIPEERVLAWHQHETEGTIESVCSLSEGSYDNIYVVVLRGSNRSIERLVQVREEELKDAVYLDASVIKDGTYSGTAKVAVQSSGLFQEGDTVTIKSYDSTGDTVTPGLFSSEDAGSAIEFTSGTAKYRVTLDTYVSATEFTGKLLSDFPSDLTNTPTSTWAFARKTFSGFLHLASQTISVLIDGAKTESVTVSAAGEVVLSDYAVKICGGLSYTSQAKTLPMSLEIEAGAQGRTKNVNQLSVRVEDCGALKVGMDEADIKSVEELKDTELKTGEFRTHVPSTWDEDTQVVIEASGAAPASVLNITTQISIGD